MSEIPAKTIAELTIASISMQFFKDNPGAGAKSFFIRVAPDIVIDIVGEEKYMELLLSGNKITLFGLHIVPDNKLEHGTCTYCWKQ